MTRHDVRAATRLERRAYGRRWPHTPFKRELRNGSSNYLVAAAPPDPDAHRGWRGALRTLRRLLPGRHSGERIVGLAGFWLMADQAHLVTVAVHPRWQRRAIATRLLLSGFELPTEAELASIALEVRASNHGARRLYERLGFSEAGRLPRYYQPDGEDAVVMLSPALDDPAWREQLRRLRAELESREEAGSGRDPG